MKTINEPTGITRAITVATTKVRGHNNKGEAIYEKIDQVLHPEETFDKFIKYLIPMNYTRVEVIGVLENKKEVPNKIKEYNDKLQKAFNTKAEVKVDHKAELEKSEALREIQNEKLEMLMNRIESLENAQNDKPEKSEERLELEDKAISLEIKFRSDISDEKLKEKIIEIEPNYKENG